MTDEERVRKVAGKISDDLYLPYEQQAMVADAVQAGFDAGVASVLDAPEDDSEAETDPFTAEVNRLRGLLEAEAAETNRLRSLINEASLYLSGLMRVIG